MEEMIKKENISSVKKGYDTGGNSKNFRTREPLNLNKKERDGLKSICKRIKDGDLIVTSTDKSSRFAVLSREQYLKSGYTHTSQDREISWDDVKYLQTHVNSHMWWLSDIVGYCDKTDSKRMNRNLQGSSLEIPEMVLLIKDHKAWRYGENIAVPSCPVVSGSRNINTHLSEFVSEILEPISREMKSGEVSSTEEALSKIDKLNEDIRANLDTPHDDTLHEFTSDQKFSELENDVFDTLVELGMERVKQDEMNKATTLSDTTNHVFYFTGEDDVNGGQNSCKDDTSNETDELRKTYENRKKNGFEFMDNLGVKSDLTQTHIKDFFSVKSDANPTTFTKNDTNPTILTRNLRKKRNLDDLMNDFKRRKKFATEGRREFNGTLKNMFKAGSVWADIDELNIEQIKKKEQVGDVNNEPHVVTEMQDTDKTPLFLGADVKALYPSMDQASTAELAFQAVKESNIGFKGFNFKRLAVYLFLTLGSDEMKHLGISEAIPRRIRTNTKAESLKADVNKKLDNWEVNLDGLSDGCKKIMIAAMMKVATIVMMMTTCYTFGGLIFLQTSGAGIGLRGSASLAKVTMGLWDQRWAKVMVSWGIRCKIFLRYIDDLRLYMYPLKKGWTWTVKGWCFNKDSVPDQRTDVQRTSEELCKSFNSIMNFLEFTTESEDDFKSGFLPTLDVQTHVNTDGYVSYKFFSKPSNNNIVIQKGTALAQDTIFSSLRQEVVRRLSNTDKETPWEERIYIVEEFIQLMVNSMHKYAFIKSVILQGISKYEYMCYRNSLDCQNPKFMPLHRAREFRREERILSKYVNKMLWFQTDSFKDPYRQLWRTRVSRKGMKKNVRLKKKITTEKLTARGKDGKNTDSTYTVGENDMLLGRAGGMIKSDKSCARTTTTMFVPQSANSQLFKLVREKEERFFKEQDWHVKVLEQPGIPLLTKFAAKFPIREGCARGSLCKMCTGDGVKCTPKGVIYEGSCLTCKMNGNVATQIYIGETSRPVRERIIEHMKNAGNLDPESFIVEHWADKHGTDVVCPVFRFKIVRAYGDALRRQIHEAVLIQERGTLNRKSEFNMNELCGLVSSKPWKSAEDELIKESRDRADHKKKMYNFVTVMESIQNVSKTGCKRKNLIDDSLCYRIFGGPVAASNKRRKMLTSTPVTKPRPLEAISGGQTGTHRQPVDTSILTVSSGSQQDNSLVTLSSGPSHGVCGNEKTGISDDLTRGNITIPPSETSSGRDRRLFNQTRDWDRAAKDNDIIRRSSSLPDLRINLSENVLFNCFPRRNERRSVDNLLQIVGESFDEYVSQWSNGGSLEFKTPGNGQARSDESDDYVSQWSNGGNFEFKTPDAGQARFDESDDYVSQWSNGGSFEFKTPDAVRVRSDTVYDSKTSSANGVEALSDVVKGTVDEGPSYSDILLKINKLTLNTEGIPLNILNMPATPGNTGRKRFLCISPDTPMGKPGKELRYELMECGSPDLRKMSGEQYTGGMSDGLGEYDHLVPDVLVENNQNKTASSQHDVIQKVSDGLVENNHAIGGVVGDDSNDKQLPSINDLLMKRPIRCVTSSVGKTKNKRKKKAIKGGKQQVDVNQKLISDLMRQDLKEDDQN